MHMRVHKAGQQRTPAAVYYSCSSCQRLVIQMSVAQAQNLSPTIFDYLRRSSVEL